MPEPEQEMSRAELKQLADLVLGGKIQDDKDLQEAKSILESHGVQHPYTAMHDDQDKSAFQRNITDPLVTGAMSLAESATLGIGERIAGAVDPGYTQRQAVREQQNPGAALTGTIGGYMLPQGLPGRITQGIGAGVRMLPGMAARMSPAALQAARPMAGLGQRMATSVPVGAATDVAVTAAEKGVATAAGEETGDWGADLARAALVGAGMGPLGELVSTAGQAAFHGLRETDKFMPYMSHLEAGGGGPKVMTANLPGLGKPTGFDEVMRRARRDRAASATEQTANEAAPYIGRAIGESDSATRARQEALNESYYASSEGRTGQGTDEIVDELVRSVAKRGESIFRNEGDLAKLRGFMDNAMEVVAVPRGGTRPSGNTVHRLAGGEQQARQLLGDNPVQDALARSGASGTGMMREPRGLGPHTGEPQGLALRRPEQETWARVNDPVTGAPGAGPAAAPGGGAGIAGHPELDFYVVPKKVDARTLDTINRDLERLVEEGFPDAEIFQRAAFRVRDKFPGNEVAPNPSQPEVLADGTEISSGWSFAKRKMRRELDQMEATKKASGLRANESVTDVQLPESPGQRQELTNQVLRIARGIEGYGKEGTAKSVEFVERLLANNPEGADVFRRFLASKAYEKVRNAVGARVTGGMNLASGRAYQFMTGLGDVMKMRMDPVARQAMRVTPELGGRAGVPLENLQLLESLLGRKEE